MKKAKSYIQARELLFTRLLILSTIGILLICLLNLLLRNYEELYVSISFLLVFSIVWFCYKKISKGISHHLLIWSFAFLLCFPVFYQGKSYYAILIYPIAGLIYNFVFFENKKILWIYFGLLLVLEFFLLASSMKIELAHIPDQFYAEYINCVSYMICLFVIGQFFISNLKKQQADLTLAEIDIKEKQRELIVKNETLDKYIESNIQLESFAHLAAHELKAPLRSISGFAGLLRRKIKDKLTPDEDNMFGIISTSNRQMHDMIGALNQLGSVSKMKLNPAQFDCQELISEILFDRKESINESNAVIEVDIKIPLITADRTLLKQLVSNLIGNGLKFVEEETIPELKIVVKKTKNDYVFSVDDNGIGIKLEDQEKILTLFERLNNSNSFSGSGIGLAICKKIVDLHQGEIWVEALTPKGSRFVFSFPEFKD